MKKGGIIIGRFEFSYQDYLYYINRFLSVAEDAEKYYFEDEEFEESKKSGDKKQRNLLFGRTSNKSRLFNAI